MRHGTAWRYGSGAFLFLLAAALLQACGGDDGDRGPAGLPGPRSAAPEALEVTITDVRIGSPPVVDFEVTDQAGFTYTDLDESALGFTVSKLIPGSDGNTSRWQTYMLADDGGIDNAQGTTYSDGTLTNHGDGTYTFRFADNLQDISGISFEASLTHRVGMEVRDPEFDGEAIPGTDATYTFRPSDGATTGIPTRKLVAQKSCAECHGTEEFAFHGGPRQSVDFCVTCHQPGSVDGETGNTMDFRVMIHKIHMGEELPSVQAGGDYAFCGFGCETFGAPPTSFAHVGFPQDQRNCTKCHDPADSATPDADNFARNPTLEACGACHDDVDFTGGDGDTSNDHPGGLGVTNAECTNCHTENRVAGSVQESHTIDSKVAAQRFEYNILNITNTAEGASPQITFSITDPTNGDAPYDIANDAPFTGGGTSVNMDIAWPTSDYTNVANGTGTAVTGAAPARPVSITLSDGSGSLPTYITDNGNGTYTVDTSSLSTPLTIPATTPPLGSGAVAIEGHTAGDFDGDGTFDDQVPVTGAVSYFAINDTEVQPRRQVVASMKCQDCHGQNDGLAFHGNNRTDNVQLCVVCHNPNNTDLARRPTDSTEDGTNTSAADGLEERAIDLRRMIHAIHGGGMRTQGYFVYGFTGAHDFSNVGYPRGLNECEACHVNDSQVPPLPDGVLATTMDTQATGTGDAAAVDPTDDGNITATASACSACHDTTEALAHMRDLGGAGLNPEGPLSVVSTVSDGIIHQSDIDDGFFIESCGVCHGEGDIADVNEAHGLTE